MYQNDQFLSSSRDVPLISDACQVCGKPAAGQHYGVQSCHGCKSFFRRATLKNFRYPACVFSETCYSNVRPGARLRKCHKCRIRKCFNVGMVAQVVIHRKSISSGIIALPDMPTSQHGIQKFSANYDFVTGLINELARLESQIDKFRKSAYNPVYFPNLEEVIQSPSQLSLADKYEPMHGWPLTEEEFFAKQHAAKMSIFTDAVGDFIIPPPDSEKKLNSNLKNWLAFDMMTAIEYAKTFNFFQLLSYNDKLAIVKSSTFMNIFVTSAFQSFTKKVDVIQMPDGISTSQLVIRVTNREMGERVRKQGDKIMGPLIRGNVEKAEYLLLKVLILCNTAAPNLSPHGQKNVEKERQKYCSALLRYCRTRYDVKNGLNRFCSILDMFGILERIQKDIREILLAINMFIRDKLIPRDKNRVMPKLLQNELLNI